MTKHQKVTAIIPSLTLGEVSKALSAHGVPGMTVIKVRGFGDYRNFYSRDNMTDCARIEIFAELDNTKNIVNIIAKTVHQGMSTDGVIAITPVDEFMHIQDYSEENDDE